MTNDSINEIINDKMIYENDKCDIINLNYY